MKGGVILLHGLARKGGSMGRLAAAARREGYVTCSPTYPGRRRSIADLVTFLAPTVAAFETTFEGPVHFVTHSLGGLVTRALIQVQRPARLGRVVMLAPPNAGSEVADLVYRVGLNRVFLGPAGLHLRTARADDHDRLLGAIDFELGVIAGNRAFDPIFPRLIFRRPNDGKVAVASTRVAGMADYIVLPVSHPLMRYDARVAMQTMAFLNTGRFRR